MFILLTNQTQKRHYQVVKISRNLFPLLATRITNIFRLTAEKGRWAELGF